MSATTHTTPVADRDMLGATLLALCMFTTGGAGLVIEYVIATTTSFIMGSSIIVFSLVIGVMMGAMGFSGWIQEKIGDNLLLEKFFAIEVALALAGGFAPVVLYYAYGAMPDHFQLVLYSLTVLIGGLIGLEIPVVMRIIDNLGIGLKTNLKHVIGADYLGAMAFMFLWVFWLLPSFPITEVSFMVSGANFSVAILAIAYFGRRGGFANLPAVIIVSVIVAGALFYGYTQNRTWGSLMEQKFYEDPIVASETTLYQRLVITKSTTSRCGEELRLYINGNTQFASCDEMIYHENLVHPAMHTARSNDSVLILGGGDGLALRDVLAYDPEHVMLVDLDPQMIEFAATNEYLRKLNNDAFESSHVVAEAALGVGQDSGLFVPVVLETDEIDPATNQPVTEEVTYVRRMHVDAAKFVENFKGTYDVIIIDLPDPNSVELSKLYTTWFYANVGKRLKPGGQVVVQSTSPMHAPEVFLEIGRTMRAAGFEVLPYHDNVPAFGDWGYWLGCSGKGCSDDSLRTLSRLQSFQVPTRYLTPERLRANQTFGAVDGVPFLDSSKSDVINTLTNPTMFMRYEQAWKGE
jgi:spermidine synthase